MLLKINPDNPEGRKIKQVIESLQKNGVIVYPTDSVYGLGCDIFSRKAVDTICRLRGINPAKARLTFICKDLKQVAEYAHQLDNHTFKLLKKNIPGPFTFILRSNNKVPKLFKNRKRTIGVRIPSNPIALTILEELGHPILSLSLRSSDEIAEYYTDPYDIFEEYNKRVDIIIDGGPGKNKPSTIVDCTGDESEIVRQGIGELIY